MKRLIALIVLMFCAGSCNDKSKNNRATSPRYKETKNVAHWSYQGETGPEYWDELEEHSDCNGKRQSPINIIDINAVNDSLLKPIEFHYSSSVKIHDVTNNGHSIQYNFEKGDYILLKNEKYELIQIHFHEPSEHTLNGVRYPIETHMVHVNKNKQIAVVSILGKEGVNNKAFEFLESYLPIQVGKTKKIDNNFNLNLNLPDNRQYYNYSGSLTTPPCTEDVDWYVFKTPISLSVNQVNKLQKLMPLNNYRNEQLIHSRIIKKYE